MCMYMRLYNCFQLTHELFSNLPMDYFHFVIFMLVIGVYYWILLRDKVTCVENSLWSIFIINVSATCRLLTCCDMTYILHTYVSSAILRLIFVSLMVYSIYISSCFLLFTVCTKYLHVFVVARFTRCIVSTVTITVHLCNPADKFMCT